MLPRKNIKCCNDYFSAFWIFFRQTLFKFFDSNSEHFSKYDAFCSQIFNYACLRRKTYCYRRGSTLWKNYIYQKHSWKRVVRWLHTPHPTPPLHPPLAISYKSNQKSLIYFSHLALFDFFLLKSKVKREGRWGGGGMAQCPCFFSKFWL